LITKQARQRIEEETRKRIEERRKFITEKCGQPKDLNGLSDGKIIILRILIGKEADFGFYNCFIYIFPFSNVLHMFLSTDQLKAVCRDYHERIKKLESEKYDLEKETSVQTNEVSKIMLFPSH
jgi:hypothetical protein